jgi:hypothetical protein
MGKIIMNEELKNQLVKAAMRCAESAESASLNSELTLTLAKSAELLTRAMLNVKNSEGICFNDTILEITDGQ